MEIRTCEEYVLNELYNLNNEYLEAKKHSEEIEAKYQYLLSNYKLLTENIKKIAKVRKGLSGNRYICFVDPYEEYDPELFSSLIRLIPDLPEGDPLSL
jgi:hypothetical protein